MSTTKWTIDPAHSEIQFKVKHLVITTITGSFKEFSGTLTADEGFENASAHFEADINSVSTNNEQRDAHLKSADFFDAEKFPIIKFDSVSYNKKNNGESDLTGNLTIRGTTRPVTFRVSHEGVVTDPWGNTKAGFELQGNINRKDFGLTWNATTEAGGLLVGEDVRLIGNIQLLKN